MSRSRLALTALTAALLALPAMADDVTPHYHRTSPAPTPS